MYAFIIHERYASWSCVHSTHIWLVLRLTHLHKCGRFHELEPQPKERDQPDLCVWFVARKGVEISGVHPWSPCHFAKQLSTGVLPNLRPSYLSHDCSSYVSRPILAPPPLWMQKQSDRRAHDFAHCPDLWHQPRFSKFTCAWSWRLRGINLGIRHRQTRKSGLHFGYLTLIPLTSRIGWAHE